MTIEVKQIIIKSTVTNGLPREDGTERQLLDIEQLKASLLEECREMISDTLNDKRER